jgi:hypothetical protein
MNAGSSAGSISISNPTQWADDFLKLIGAKITPTNQAEVVGWETAEGGNWHNSAQYNPLNTTYVTGTSQSVINGVQAYQSWASGLTATLQTIDQSTYTSVVEDLKNSAPYATFAASLGNSPWDKTHYGSPPGSDILKDIGAPSTIGQLSSNDAILTSTTKAYQRKSGLGGVLQSLYLVMTPTSTPALAANGSIGGTIRNGALEVGSRGIVAILGLALIGVGGYLLVKGVDVNPIHTVQAAQRISQGKKRLANTQTALTLSQQRVTASVQNVATRSNTAVTVAQQRANAAVAAAQHRAQAAAQVAQTHAQTRMATAKMRQNTNRANRRLRREERKAREAAREQAQAAKKNSPKVKLTST